MGGCMGVVELSVYLWMHYNIQWIPRKRCVIVSQVSSLVVMAFFLSFGFAYDSVLVP
jgi:hypothetical protein